ncbi:HK97-gp10 family putative phage morphogenesis protein [Acerihabitans sp. KWT182]|uniref:HK97-gp10 family putative phage morphogenesis protein n=1 Tax=Acerihabitans sp. KWT182 TaxID=3157919 RepID=A0AAU7QG06_9GAMM
MFSIEVQGLTALERQLTDLAENKAVKVLRDAGRAALAPVLDDMKHNAGYDAKSPGPHMRDSIAITSTNRLSDTKWITVVTLRVGPSKEQTMKALAQEFGTVKQVARPFMRPALDYNTSKILRILAVQIRAGLSNS